MKFSFSSEKMISFAWCMVLAYAAMLIPVDALAATSWGAGAGATISGGSGGGGGGYGGGGGGTIGDVLCNVAGWFVGPVGQGIATLAILVVGIGALMGKVSWGMAIIVGIGIAVIFGAPAIVSELVPDQSGCGY